MWKIKAHRHPRQQEQEKQRCRILGTHHPPEPEPSQHEPLGSTPAQLAGGRGRGALTYMGHPTDRRGDDLHGIHGDFVDHLFLQVPLMEAVPAICLECRTKRSLPRGWQGACCGLGCGLLTPTGLGALTLSPGRLRAANVSLCFPDPCLCGCAHLYLQFSFVCVRVSQTHAGRFKLRRVLSSPLWKTIPKPGCSLVGVSGPLTNL